jgi:hypothetical protein
MAPASVVKAEVLSSVMRIKDDYIYNMSGCEHLPFGEEYTKRGNSASSKL